MNPAPTPDSKDLRKFGLLMGGVIAVLFGLGLPWLFGYAFPKWPWLIGAIFWLWALALPKTLLPVFKGWMRVGHALGIVNSRIILGVAFYILITPMGLIMRLFKRDPMARRFNDKSESYRVPSDSSDHKNMEKPY